MKKFFSLTLLLASSFVVAQSLYATDRDLSKSELQAALSALCESKIDLARLSCFPQKTYYSQIERDPKSRLELEKKGIVGSFSKAGSKQIIANAQFLDQDGSEERFVAPVSVLLENNKVVRQAQYGDSSSCFVFARGDGRDGLVCLNQGFGQGYLESALEWRDIGVGAKSAVLMQVSDNVGACGNPAKQFNFGGMEAVDLNKDKKKDLVLNLNYVTAPNPNCDVDLSKVKGKDHRLGFLWDGKAFKPDSATAALLKTW